MKALLFKYVPPLAVSLLLSAVFHSLAFSAVVAALAFAFTYYGFFQDSRERANSLGAKVLAYGVLAAVFGALFALIIGKYTAQFEWGFNLFLCAGWGCMFPQMMRNMWNSK